MYAQTVKKAVSLSSKNHQLWTSLGVIAATPGTLSSRWLPSPPCTIRSLPDFPPSTLYITIIETHSKNNQSTLRRLNKFVFLISEINSPSLAQHAFIRSLQEEKYVSRRRRVIISKCAYIVLMRMSSLTFILMHAHIICYILHSCQCMTT